MNYPEQNKTQALRKQIEEEARQIARQITQAAEEAGRKRLAAASKNVVDRAAEC